MELVILLIVLIAIDIAALRWGYDSRNINSAEWERHGKTFFPAHHH